VNGNAYLFTIIHDRCTALYGYFRNACVTHGRYEVTTDGQQLAAWCEFAQEAGKTITLDHMDPAMTGIPE
jgi:hypothetical protein